MRPTGSFTPVRCTAWLSPVRWRLLSGRGAGPEILAAAILSVALEPVACRETPIVRRGPAQQRVVARTYGDSPVQARAKMLDAFGVSRSRLPAPFRHMTANALQLPWFSPDWVFVPNDTKCR